MSFILGFIAFLVLEIMFSIWVYTADHDGPSLFFSWLVISAFLFVACMVAADYAEKYFEKRKLAPMEPAERERYLENKAKDEERKSKELNERLHAHQYGTINRALLCPHCQSKGFVRMTQTVRVTKNRVNSVAGKAIGLGTNSESQVTQLHCDKCSMTWDA